MGPLIYERYFLACVTTEKGINWEQRSIGWLKAKDIDWKKMALKFDQLSEQRVLWEDLGENSLVAPIMPNFPFVDCYWKEKTELHAVQVTVSPTRPKKL